MPMSASVTAIGPIAPATFIVGTHSTAHRAFRDVDTMSGHSLIGLRVSARGGDGIGRIRDVDRNSAGRVIRVSVSTGEGTVTWIDADDLRFDPVNREVMTDLSRHEVDGMAHPRF